MIVSFNTPTVDHQSALVATVLVVAALASSIAFEIYKRHYDKKNVEKMGKAVTVIILSALGSAFTALGYIIVLLQSNASYFSTLPFVGKHFTGVVGIAVIIYGLRLNTTYKTVTNKLNQWVGKQPTSQVAEPLVTPIDPLG